MERRTFYNSVTIPPVVQSTAEMDHTALVRSVSAGLDAGYRAFDTARDYGNERDVGIVLEQCLHKKGLARNDIFITTKVGNGQQKQRNMLDQIHISLDNLRTDYVDLWLLHWPLPGYFIDNWRQMEKILAKGLVRSIGIANINVRYLKQLFDAGIEVKPHCCQFELHPMRTSPDIVAFLRENKIAIQAYSPLCRMASPIRESVELKGVMERTGRTLSQVVLRWHIQRGFIPVFKSATPSRLRENADIFNFELSPDEMLAIDALDQDYKYWPESYYCPGY